MKNAKSKEQFLFKALLIIIFIVIFISGCILMLFRSNAGTIIGQKIKQPSVQNIDNTKTSTVEIQTTKGNIRIVLENQKAPATSANFLKSIDLKVYDGVVFNKNFDWIIQSDIPNEDSTNMINNIPLQTNQKLLNVTGIIGMAESENPKFEGKNFYILKKDAPWLDNKTAVFGHVVFGMNVVNKIEAGDKIITITKVK